MNNINIEGQYSPGIDIESIAAELKGQDRWVVWKLIPRKDKPGTFQKIPFDAKTHDPASCSDRSTWSSFDVAVQAFRRGAYNGIGFQLGDGNCGIDLDNCRDKHTGGIAAWAIKIVRFLPTYCEVSPSGSGLHLFARGTLPPGPRVRKFATSKIEMYDSMRFLTFTGWNTRNTPITVEDRSAKLKVLHGHLFSQKQNTGGINPQVLTFPQSAILEKTTDVISKMPESSGFKRLFDGDHSAYGSQSEADLALCAKLALRFGCDATLIDSLFRRSNLFRAKWDEVHSADGRTYGWVTIAKAIDTAFREFRNRFDVRTPLELRERARSLGRVPFIVEGLFPARSLALLAGDSGVGKSPLLCQLGLCVAAGIPFLGYKVRRGRVLYLDFENGVSQVDSLVTQLARHLGLTELPQNLNLWKRNDSKQEGLTGTIQKMIIDLKPALVIVDSLGSFAPGIESKNEVANRMLQMLRGVIRDSGATIILVHHVRKQSRKRGEAPEPLEKNLHSWFQEVRGPRALINGSDIRLGVSLPHSGRIVTSSNGQSEIAFVLRGFARVQGEIPISYVTRTFDSDGTPLGYEKLSGVGLLRNPEQEVAFLRLPSTFRFKDAQRVYGKGAQPTVDFLNKCVSLGLLQKVGREYKKTDASSNELSIPTTLYPLAVASR